MSKIEYNPTENLTGFNKLTKVVVNCYIKNFFDYKTGDESERVQEFNEQKEALFDVEHQETEQSEFFGDDGQCDVDDNYFHVSSTRVEIDNENYESVFKLNKKTTIQSVEEKPAEDSLFIKKSLCESTGGRIIITEGRIWDLYIFKVKTQFNEIVDLAAKKTPYYIQSIDELMKKPETLDMYGWESVVLKDGEDIYIISGYSD